MSIIPSVTGYKLIKALQKLGFEVIRRRIVTTSCAIQMGGAQLYRYIVEKQLGADSLLKSFETANSPEKISRKFSDIKNYLQ